MVVASEVELYDLRATQPRDHEQPEVSIRYGDVPEHLADARLTGPAYEADRASYLLKAPQLRCWAREGKEIVVQADAHADAGTMQTFILGSALPALCYQRGLLPLSATAVQMDGGAVAFVGASGSGKSTLGAFLSQRGYPLLSDDMIAVCTEPGPAVHPLRQRLRLWRDVLDVLRIDHRSAAPDRPGLQRYRVEPQRVATGLLPLRRLYMLGARPDAPPDRFERLRRLEAVGAVADMLIQPALCPLVCGPERQFRQLVSIVGNATVVRWTRRLDFGEIEAQLDAVETDVETAAAQRRRVPEPE